MNPFAPRLAAILVLVAPASAFASGFLAARFGGELGNPVTDNLTSIYYNPAGLALGRGTRFYLDGSFALRTVDYTRPRSAISSLLGPGEVGAGTPAEAAGANSGEANLTNFLVSPFLGIGTDFGSDKVGFALGVFVPFGGQAVWGKNEAFENNDTYPGAVDGVQRWSTIEGTIRSLYVSLGGAYRFDGPRISLGLAANLVRSSVFTVRGRNLDGSDDLTTSDGSLKEGRSLIDVENTTYSLGFGVMWEAADGLRIGASYQSQPGFGEMIYDGTLSTALSVNPDDIVDIEFTQTLPDVIRLGASWRASRLWEFRLFGEYDRWSVLDRQCLVNKTLEGRCVLLENGQEDTEGGGRDVILNIQREWKDAIGVRGNASYYLNPDLQLIVGAGYDGNAVPDGTIDASLLDMPKISASLAAVAVLEGSVFLNGTYTHIFYLEREVPQSEIKQFQGVSRNPSGAGTYNQTIDLLVLGVGYRL